MTRPYQRCTRCVMDTTDPNINFSENGFCNHCNTYLKRIQNWPPESVRSHKLNEKIKEIKLFGKNKKYDCVIGVSGGVDSTYLALLIRKLGLQPLAVHFDNGWDSKLAIENINSFLTRLDIDMYTVKVDREQFRDLQISFLKSSTPDAEVPSDHAIWASMYQTAAKFNIRYLLPAVNWFTESILPIAWSYGRIDWEYIKSVHSKFGKAKLSNYPHISLFDQDFYYKVIKKVEYVNIFNYIYFNKEDVMNVLIKELEWKPYGNKHYESIYTRFIQGYVLPEKFNIDKRKAHLSTLIMAGQLSRKKALEEIEKPPYDAELFKLDKKLILEKLNLSETEFNKIMKLPIKNHTDYKTLNNYPKLIKSSLRIAVDVIDGTAAKRIYKVLPSPIKDLYRSFKA